MLTKKVPDDLRADVADMLTRPGARHGIVARQRLEPFTAAPSPEDANRDFGDHMDALMRVLEAVRGDDLTVMSDLLAAQAITLDVLFTEMLSRAHNNRSEHPQAFDRYMAIALKAQGQSRTTIEALGKITRGGEQVVRHIHVHEGGQAVIAETVNTGGSGAANAGIAYQPHALGAPVPGTDAARDLVPVSGHSRKEAVPNARRRQPRRTKG